MKTRRIELHPYYTQGVTGILSSTSRT